MYDEALRDASLRDAIVNLKDDEITKELIEDIRTELEIAIYEVNKLNFVITGSKIPIDEARDIYNKGVDWYIYKVMYWAIRTEIRSRFMKVDINSYFSPFKGWKIADLPENKRKLYYKYKKLVEEFKEPSISLNIEPLYLGEGEDGGEYLYFEDIIENYSINLLKYAENTMYKLGERKLEMPFDEFIQSLKAGVVDGKYVPERCLKYLEQSVKEEIKDTGCECSATLIYTIPELRLLDLCSTSVYNQYLKDEIIINKTNNVLMVKSIKFIGRC